ncbi:MAG: VCBS repeat-containing protein [Chloroflexi bacterium]|nr:VCBS repeat-containing protein [Chloroflexota bacterium]
MISSPVAYDWDGDGRREIAVGSWDGFFYLLDSELRPLPGWPKYSRRGFFSSPALCDLDGDGAPEILVGSDMGKLYAWHVDGADAEGFPVPVGYRTWASPAVLPGGRIAIGGLGQMLMVDRRGRPVEGWPAPMPNWADATAAVGPDLLVVTTLLVGTRTAGALVAWHLDGRPYPWSPMRLAVDSDSSPALADLTDDGRMEIIFGDDEGLLHVVDLDGRALPGFSQRTGDLIEASPAIADLDGDGSLDIAVGSWDGRMYVWDARGKLLPGWPIQVGDQIISSAALIDLDGDDRLDIVVGSKDNHLYGWRADGTPLPGFPRDLGHHVFSSPWVGDINGDGRADVVVGANNGLHLLLDVGPLGRAAWPMFHRDIENSGAVP